MNIYSVYWIHLLEHTDIMSEGYVGVSNNPKRRLSEHKLASKKQLNVNPYFERILNKHSVTQTIVFQGTEEECYLQEEKLRPVKNLGWNINKGGQKPPSMKGVPRSDETKKKISKSLTGHTHSKETREKISKKSKQRICSEETRQKISNSLIGKKRPEEVVNKISNSKKGKPGKSPSNETRKKLSNAFKNRHFSEETRSKISAAKKEYWRIKKSLIA
jgi:hypothetical protein